MVEEYGLPATPESVKVDGMIYGGREKPRWPERVERNCANKRDPSKQQLTNRNVH